MSISAVVSAFLIFAAAACTQLTGNGKYKPSLVYKDLLVYNTFRDTCIVSFYPNGDTIRFHRRFKIMENTFTDTMSIAFHSIYPGTLGERFSGQYDTLTSSAIDVSDENQRYLIENDLPELYTTFLCMRHRSGKVKTPAMAKQKAGEYMRIRIWYKEEGGK